MTERKPQRLSAENVTKAKFPFGIDEYGDIPGELTDEQVLRRQPYYDDDERAHDDLSRLSGYFQDHGVDLWEERADGTDGGDFDVAHAMVMLRLELQSDPMRQHLAPEVTKLLAEVTRIERVLFEKRARALTRAVRALMEPLYVGGAMQIGVPSHFNAPRVDFATPLQSVVSIQNIRHFHLEPVVQGIDGTTGIIPIQTNITGLYAVEKVASFEKKYHLRIPLKSWSHEEIIEARDHGYTGFGH